MSSPLTRCGSMRLACLILAAGEGSRFGGRKQLALCQSKPLLGYVLQELSPIFGHHLYTVLGAYRDEVTPYVESVSRIIVHDAWRNGLGTSIAEGVRRVAEIADYDGIMLVLGDQIGVKRDAFSDLIRRFEGEYIVTSHYAGKNGAPAIFPAAMFDTLKCMTGDDGARQLLRSDIELIAVPLPEAEIDIDTLEDWHKWRDVAF